jgi:hypothetical protein
VVSTWRRCQRYWNLPARLARVLRPLSNAFGAAAPGTMVAPSTSVKGVEAVGNAISRTPQTWRDQGLGGPNGRQPSRPVADRGLTHPIPRAAEYLLRRTRTPPVGRAVLTQSAEPPYADLHVRWCGRLGGATRSPMPIDFLTSLVPYVQRFCSHQVHKDCDRELSNTGF